MVRVGALLGLSLVALALPVAAQSVCPPAPPQPALLLPHLRAALDRGQEAMIVALGSSSTEGVMASDSAHTYPAVLQATLTRALPHAHLAVLNRGIGGQDAVEELARLDADVLAVRPQLVIWQVGANAALRHADPVRFRHRVSDGVQRMRDAGIDVVLMDNQHSPSIDATPEHGLLDEMLAEVAETAGASLFSRAGLMAAWERGGTPMQEFIAPDGLHHNNRGYTCVALALSDAIVSAVQLPRALSASR